VAQYYSRQGYAWARWNADGLTLDPPVRPTVRYYAAMLRRADYGLVTLFYSTSFTTANLPASILTAPRSASSNEVLASAALSANEPGLAALTIALRRDHAYRLVRSGAYDNATDHGVYLIWRKVTSR